MPIRGQVKWFDPKKGFGFIVGPEDQDVFVHFSQIQGDGFRLLRDGETVDYELVEGDKGFQAREVNRTETSTYSNSMKTAVSVDDDDLDDADEDGDTEDVGTESQAYTHEID